MSKKPIRVAVTGPAGQIGYSILFRIASGSLFGPDQPVILNMLERDIPESQARLKGVMMELADGAYPLLADMNAYSDPVKAFQDADVAFLIGSRPRGPGMERAELLDANAEIFRVQGRALNESASRDVKVLVVGNPCNTNAYIAMRSAPDLSPKCFTAMLRLDQNRFISQLAQKTGKPVASIEGTIVWGNHSPAMYPDLQATTIDGVKAVELIDEAWYVNELIPTVGKRGAAIIEARGASSAASAASAAIDHIRDWHCGSHGKSVTMGVISQGEYGIPEGLIFGMPCICENGQWRIVEGLTLTDTDRQRMQKSIDELEAERAHVRKLFD